MPNGAPVSSGVARFRAPVNLRGGESRYLIHSYAGEAELRYTLAVARGYREVIIRLNDSWGAEVAVRAGSAERPAQMDVRDGEVERPIMGSEEPKEVFRRALLKERHGLRP